MKNLCKSFYLTTLFALVNCQMGDFDYLAYEVPSPLSTNISAFPLPRQDGGPLGVGLAGEPPIPPPQNFPVNPLGPGLEPGLPGGLVPFGLNHIILIIVPMFKAKFRKLPKWLSSTIKISMPITVFFDKLTVPPGMFLPGIGGIPLPLGAPPPLGLQPPGVAPPPPSSHVLSPNAGGAPNPNVQMSNGYAYPQTYPYNSNTGYDDANPEEPYSEESYDNENYYSEEERKRRWKRAFSDNTEKSRHKRALTFNATVHSAERAALIPRLGNLLEHSGLGGKSCLLRTICEIHEAPLNHYGLLGELFTMFFSVSRSVFAESHLSEYLRAEELGKSGDCTEYFRHCDNTIFSWEEVKTTKRKKKKKNIPYVVNVIDEVL